MDIQVSFPGGKRVDAQVGDFVLRTDQPVSGGGNGSAPEPFSLFLASLATCAGLYVVGFCQARQIPLDGVTMTQHSEYGDKGRLASVRLEIHVPPSFPAQYVDAVARAAAACKVKKTLADPPIIEVATVVEGAPQGLRQAI